MNDKRSIRPQLKLEMTMRDVLGNMEEMASEFAFHDMGGEFEILSIERPTRKHATTRPDTPIAVRELFSAEVCGLHRSATRVA